jgi:hypothetical protein
MKLSGLKALPNGKVIDFNNIKGYEFTIEEIADLLSHVKRFNGYGMDVASHSLWVANTLFYLTGNPHIALLGLMHDAQEAYIGDIATPVKDVAGSDWGRLENNVQRAILWHLNIKHEYNLGAEALIKLVDQVSLKLEYQQMKAARIYKEDNEGVWEAALANVPNIDDLEPPKQDQYSAVDFVFAYNHYKALCEEDITYTSCSYLLDGKKHTCAVDTEYLETFFNKL